MSNKVLKKSFLLFTGCVAVIVIALTQSFYKPTIEEKISTQTEQADASDRASIHAPSDVVANGNALALNNSADVIAGQVSVKEEPKKVAVILKQGLFKFFRTLFRTSIAPNAP
jgi:hypothetical protein